MAKNSWSPNLDEIAANTAEAAQTAPDAIKGTIEKAAEVLAQMAAAQVRKDRKQEPAIAELPDNATAKEVSSIRCRQAIRKGSEVYLPSWNTRVRVMPSVLLRSSLFSSSRDAQKSENRERFDSENSGLIHKEIATFKDISVTLSGHGLCQFDRYVYSTCLEYYRHRPLASTPNSAFVQVSFYKFAEAMSGAYGPERHKAIRDSLLRLSAAHIRIRSDKFKIELPKLLVVQLEDDYTSNNNAGRHKILFQVPEGLAELFGPGYWTTVSSDVSKYDGLKGWLAHFYASHTTVRPLPVKAIRRLSGYESHSSNFLSSLKNALKYLESEKTPVPGRLKSYHFIKDETLLQVHKIKAVTLSPALSSEHDELVDDIA